MAVLVVVCPGAACEVQAGSGSKEGVREQDIRLARGGRTERKRHRTDVRKPPTGKGVKVKRLGARRCPAPLGYVRC